MKPPIPFIIEKLEAQKLLLFCRAGISASPPANLPLAKELVEEVLALFLDDLSVYVSRISVRPEVLFQIILQSDNHHLFPSMKELLASNEITPNHSLAAHCLDNDCPVVTTNFDLLIEEAVSRKNIDINVTSFAFSTKSPSSTLFKIHGSIDDLDSLVFTINQLRRGLGPIREETLQEIVRDRTILVIGYSGLDQLDIMPVLAKSQYSEIIWIEHDGNSSEFYSKMPYNTDISSLHRLHYYAGPTDLIACQILNIKRPNLARNFAPPKISIPIQHEKRLKICIDLLMYQNDYEEIIDVLSQRRPKGDLFFDIRLHEAKAVVYKRDSKWRRNLKDIRERLFSLATDQQAKFLPEIAKYVDTPEKLMVARTAVEKALQQKRSVTEPVAEAGVEIAYELIWRRYYPEALLLLSRLEKITKENSFLLVEARVYIERAYLLAEKYYNYRKDQRYLSEGLKAADKAIYFLEKPILNDCFFLSQTKSNKATLLALQGEFDKAEQLYKEALSEFEATSPNGLIATTYYMAWLHYLKGSFGKSLKLLQEVITLNIKHGRRYYRGFAYRLEAIIKEHNIGKGSYDENIAKLLQISAKEFQYENNEAEMKISLSMLEDYRCIYSK